MTAAGTALCYGIFALIATGINLLTQCAVLSMPYSSVRLYAAIAAGTVTGLAVKFVLDRRWIFHYRAISFRANAATFTLYVIASGMTTIIFWTFELVFNLLLPYPSAKFVGAVCGLSIGYTIKYFIDRRFVFVAKRARAFDMRATQSEET